MCINMMRHICHTFMINFYEFSLSSDILEKITRRYIKDQDIFRLDPRTRRLAFGLNRNDIPCVCTAHLRNRQVSLSWSHTYFTKFSEQ